MLLILLKLVQLMPVFCANLQLSTTGKKQSKSYNLIQKKSASNANVYRCLLLITFITRLKINQPVRATSLPFISRHWYKLPRLYCFIWENFITLWHNNIIFPLVFSCRNLLTYVSDQCKRTLNAPSICSFSILKSSRFFSSTASLALCISSVWNKSVV